MIILETWRTAKKHDALLQKLKSKNFENHGFKYIKPYGFVEEWYNIENDETVLLQKA